MLATRVCNFRANLSPSRHPTKDTVSVGSGWGMGSIGGWLSESSFAGARLTDDLIPDMGGRLYGTGAGFNTWKNRADKPSGTRISMGASLLGTLPIAQSGALFSNVDEQIAYLQETGILGPFERKEKLPNQTKETLVVVQGPPIPRPPVQIRPCP